MNLLEHGGFHHSHGPLFPVGLPLAVGHGDEEALEVLAGLGLDVHVHLARVDRVVVDDEVVGDRARPGKV